VTAVVNIVLPVFAIILAGFLSGRFGVLGEASSAALNRFVYYFALPPLLFLSMARAPVDQIFNLPFIAAYMGGVAGTLVIALAGGAVLFKNRGPALGLHAMAAVFANTAYMGIPLFLAAFGKEGTLPAVVATMASNVILIAAIVTWIEASNLAGHGVGIVARRVFGALIRNPVVTAPTAGVAFALTALALPRPVETFLDLLGAAAGPAALFALGLSLVGKHLRAGMGEVGWLFVLKLFVHPLLTWFLVARVFTLDPFWAQGAVILAAMPAGALVFVIAQHNDIFVQRASAAIVYTTAGSVFTLSVLMSLFGTN